MVTVTECAARKLMDLVREENGNELPPAWGLRLFVQGGGCSGFQYGLKIEKESQEGDQTIESRGIRMFVDPISIHYVESAEIDFDENSVLGGGFKIKNPNAKSTCGCGQSFSTE